MNRSNILILLLIAVIVSLVLYITLGENEKVTPLQEEKQAKSVALPSVDENNMPEKSRTTKEESKLPIPKEAPLADKKPAVSAPEILSRAMEKEYGLMSITERKSLPEEIRLSKLQEAIDDWEGIEIEEQKKIERKIRMQWDMLDKKDRLMISDYWKTHKPQESEASLEKRRVRKEKIKEFREKFKNDEINFKN